MSRIMRLFSKKKYDAKAVTDKMVSYAQAGYGDFIFEDDFGSEVQLEEVFFITVDGKIASELDPVCCLDKINRFKDEQSANYFLEILREKASKRTDIPKEKTGFWYIDPCGNITNQLYAAWDVEGMKSIGNWFRTKEEAERAKEKLIAILGGGE